MRCMMPWQQRITLFLMILALSSIAEQELSPPQAGFILSMAKAREHKAQSCQPVFTLEGVDSI